MNHQSSDARRDRSPEVLFVLGFALLSIFLIAPQAVQSGLAQAVSDAKADQHWAFVKIEKSRGLPRRGQSRASVQSQFGEPQSRKGAVGDPPISSWQYADFTVYFEYDRVITTVASRDSLPNTLGDIQ